MEPDMDVATMNKIANEEYKHWKKNSPLLYDLVITHALPWPTLTVQWFPDVETPAGKDYHLHRLLVGTNTSDAAPNLVKILTVQVPKANEELKEAEYDTEKGEIGSYSSTEARIKTVQSIPHEGEVNRARYMPQNADLIATKTVMGEVYVFDRTKHPSQPADDAECKPDITLRGHTKEGYGISWSPTVDKQGHILSASEDTTVCHWDIRGYTKKHTTLDPLTIYRGHTAFVEDVAWHQTYSNVFASVGDDKQLLLWDTRGSGTGPVKPTSKVEAHSGFVNAVAFSPHSETVLLTGSSDKTIALWDTRNLKLKLHSFEAHEDDVLQLAWSPHSETVFASGSSDRRINVWDVSRIGCEQVPEDAADGPPELMFVHGGHTSQVTDLAWSPSTAGIWHLASAAEDNVLQIWSPSKAIYAADIMPIAVDDLE
ncbi:uncharacterized protein L969DRAFT_95076 [Mixia osmundae IAM 14324]|uniref:Histone-binding protein RBBP4-like N-terminal domain-containing protein n=1 Tax=Mixia osmundae (strain CBS 9802 / IAM 14324 / JCM 22182 / KY 12970) TaxID=764103 RepID=G7E7E4_MIXOS|nr:uncharacterized protein L969DRAFT_95076 [Mixia osmundae IAM 14324]KEI38913.1 hypothetical protein L969DRAFT_95076 [Mixia osmundae IAM 14324]GAA98754.1 hypothetical protein E5Q_05442 [Mixia osmundae IAM 14324]